MGGPCVAGGHGWQGGACVAGETATAVDSTHPTGIHYCISIYFSGGPRIFRGGGGVPTPEFGTTTYYLTIFFAENCMQMKEIRLKGGILHRDSIRTKFGYISQIN